MILALLGLFSVCYTVSRINHWGVTGGPGVGIILCCFVVYSRRRFVLCPDATLNTKIHKNSVRIKTPNAVNAWKRKRKYQINHYDEQRRVLMANSTVCQSK